MIRRRCYATILILLLFLGADVRAETLSKDGMRSLFDTLDEAIQGGEGYSADTNDAGMLAWSESYLLEAYLDMYEATRDDKYLTRFIRQAERVCGNTDKARGVMDYKGAYRNGWSSTKYSKGGEPVVHLVHSAMILHPLVRFSGMVKSAPELSRYGEVAGRFVVLAESGVAEFEKQWRYDPKTGQGTYWFAGDEPIETNLSAPMPLNAPLAMGQVIIELYRITGKKQYLDKATALSKYFKAGLRQGPGGTYIWGYRQDMKKWGKQEDISHGAIDVGFAARAYREGIVFTKDDMARFSRTLVQSKKDGLYHIYVDGTSDAGDRKIFSDSSGLWLELAVYDCGIYDSVYEYLPERVKGSRKVHPQVLQGIAKLMKHYDRCRGAGPKG